MSVQINKPEIKTEKEISSNHTCELQLNAKKHS